MFDRHPNVSLSLPTAERWKDIGESIFSEMGHLADKFNAINLGQGAPNFYGPKKILNAICEQMQTCHNQYAHALGELQLREHISAFIQKHVGAYYDPQNEIIITCGASEALFCILNAYLQPGDRVVLFEPAYDLYVQAIANTGAEIVSVSLLSPSMKTKDSSEQEWTIDWDTFDTIQKQGFKCIIINTPHNPTGKVFSKAEIIRIGEAALKQGAIIVADEVYENLTFEETHPYISPINYPELREITVRISSAAKTFGFTGLKIGWAVAPSHFIKGLQLVHQSTVFCLNPAIQLGLAQALADKIWLNEYLQSQKIEYRKKRDILKSALEKRGFIIPECYGTFFLCGNFKNLADHQNSLVFAKNFVESHRIATIPMASFYHKAPDNLPWVRFAFCKTNDVLELYPHSAT